jgi:hypothetical protein
VVSKNVAHRLGLRFSVRAVGTTSPNERTASAGGARRVYAGRSQSAMVYPKRIGSYALQLALSLCPSKNSLKDSSGWDYGQWK